MIQSIRRALVGTGSTALNLLGACVIGFGVPLLWVWLASTLYDKSGAVTGPVAVFIFTGILVSYWVLLLIGSWVRGRMMGLGSVPAGPRRQSWNRSMRDSTYRPGDHRSDPVERLFVTTAIVSMIAFAVWFAFFAGAPLPTQ
jgi:hypothetical protein